MDNTGLKKIDHLADLQTLPIFGRHEARKNIFFNDFTYGREKTVNQKFWRYTESKLVHSASWQ